MSGGTFRDFIMILLVVSVVALCAVILSTAVRAAFHKRSLIVDSATEHLVHPHEDAHDIGGDGRPDFKNRKDTGGGGYNGGGVFVPPSPAEAPHRMHGAPHR